MEGTFLTLYTKKEDVPHGSAGYHTRDRPAGRALCTVYDDHHNSIITVVPIVIDILTISMGHGEDVGTEYSIIERQSRSAQMPSQEGPR
jgi:hypothetical protein